MTETKESPRVIVKKDRPFLNFIKWALILGITAVIALFLIGYAMGSAGIRPSTIDPNTIIPGETSTPDNREPPHVDEAEEKDAHDELAYQAGVQSGEYYLEWANPELDFWNGWNKGATEENDDGRRKETGIEPPEEDPGSSAWSAGEAAGNLYNTNRWHREEYWKGFNSVVEGERFGEE